MAKQFVILALIFFAAVGMAAATASTTPASPAPTSGEEEGGEHVIGSISGGRASDAAPIGGPVPEGVFPTLTPAPGPTGGAAALEATTVAGAIAAARVVGSFFF